mgnify:CR=1 FL=1
MQAGGSRKRSEMRWKRTMGSGSTFRFLPQEVNTESRFEHRTPLRGPTRPAPAFLKGQS